MHGAPTTRAHRACRAVCFPTPPRRGVPTSTLALILPRSAARSVAHEAVHALHRVAQFARVGAARLREVGAAATAAADHRGDLLDELPGFPAIRQILAHGADQHDLVVALLRA